ncbi:MAG: Tropinesterase [Syntrophaceae bacterium PtaU1.Bin231]|nr:MAG: Tropinesterase [Syntrophaceae bacterium PtaU1.Bin231]
MASDAGNNGVCHGPAGQPADSVSGHVEAGGVRLHYLDYGTAGRPPMLCLHGAAAHAHWFDFVAPGLAADYHVLALDQRGHGDSAWADPPDYSYPRLVSDLAEVVDRLDLRNFVLVGHSLGGMVSLLYAAAHPGRVSRLVVIDSMQRISEERVAVLRSVGSREGGSYDTLEEFVARYRLHPSSTYTRPEIVAYLAGYSARRSADGRWRHKVDRRVYRDRHAVDGMPCWERITIPALLIKGSRSTRISPVVAAEIRARCPQVEIVELCGSGHHVPLDNAAGVVGAIRTFLGRHA